jgi:membrane protein required for colicin V production
MEGFNYIDIIVIFMIVVLGLKGYINGFLKEVFTLIGIIGGIFIASRYSYEIGTFLHDNLFAFDNDAGKNFAGFIVGIIGFAVALNLIRYVIESVTSDTAFSTLNKILGIIVGSTKIFLILSVITHAVSNIEVINKNINEFTQNSFMYPILKNTGGYIIKIDIEDFKKKPESAVEQVVSDIKEGASKELEKVQDSLK